MFFQIAHLASHMKHMDALYLISESKYGLKSNEICMALSVEDDIIVDKMLLDWEKGGIVVRTGKRFRLNGLTNRFIEHRMN